MECSDFVNIITENDIVFLYETWALSDSKIELMGYTCHNFYRDFQHRQAKRRSGGLVLYYKDSIKDGIELVKNHHNSMIWIKLDHTFFKLNNDI